MNTIEPLIDHGRMLDVLGIEGRLMVAATKHAPPEAPVPAATGRTVSQTVRHVIRLCVETLARMGVVRPCGISPRESAPAAELPEFASAELRRAASGGEPATLLLTAHLTAHLADLLGEFGTRSPEQPCAAHSPAGRTVGFWLRRMVHDLTVHRVDIQAAAGETVSPIEEAQALDGIDEILRFWFDHRLRELGFTASHSFSVAVEIGEHKWMACADPEETVAERVTSPMNEINADAHVTGDAPSMYLWLSGRLPDRAVKITGDRDAAAQLWSLLRLATH